MIHLNGAQRQRGNGPLHFIVKRHISLLTLKCQYLSSLPTYLLLHISTERLLTVLYSRNRQIVTFCTQDHNGSVKNTLMFRNTSICLCNTDKTFKLGHWGKIPRLNFPINQMWGQIPWKSPRKTMLVVYAEKDLFFFRYLGVQVTISSEFHARTRKHCQRMCNKVTVSSTKKLTTWYM